MEQDNIRSDAEILAWIQSLRSGEMDIAVPAMAKRFMQLYPDTEMIIANIPKHNKKERMEFFEALLHYVQTYEDANP